MTVYLDNDFESEHRVTRKNAATGAIEAAAGLTGLVVHFSATDAGATIHADVSVAAAERASLAGTYFGIIDGDKLRTHLASLVDGDVWEVFGDGTNVYTSQLHKVFAARPPG